MKALVLSVMAMAVAYALSPSNTAAGGARTPRAKANLCKPGEHVITSCHPKGMVFSLCGVDGPKEKYVVYREARGGGPVRQFPDDPKRYAEEFHYSAQGASAWEERVRFKMDGADHYIVSAMGKGGPVYDEHGWPGNATALIIMSDGRIRQHNCLVSDDGWIMQPGSPLSPREEFDDDLRP